MEIVSERGFQSHLIEMDMALYPFQIVLCPGFGSLRRILSMAQQELAEPVLGS